MRGELTMDPRGLEPVIRQLQRGGKQWGKNFNRSVGKLPELLILLKQLHKVSKVWKSRTILVALCLTAFCQIFSMAVY